MFIFLTKNKHCGKLKQNDFNKTNLYALICVYADIYVNIGHLWVAISSLAVFREFRKSIVANVALYDLFLDKADPG